MRRTVIFLILVGLAMSSGQRVTRAKTPAWQPSDHPRLVASPAEKNAIVAKLNAPGTASNAIWESFLSNNFTDGSRGRDYSDGAFQYWITGDTAVADQAIANAENWIDSVPSGITPGGSSFNESWYNYLDLVMTYDFAYDRIVALGKKEKFIEYIAKQGSKCDTGGPGYAPGNINTIWMYCEYASAMELEGENLSINVVDEPVFFGLPGSAQALDNPINDSNFKITNAPGSVTADYTEGVDYTYHYVPGCSSRCIDWAPSGAGTKEPSIGATYYISYTFTPDVAVWKSSTRSAIEYHLNYQWHDGYYQGGLNPYGNLVAEELPVFIEMLRRDTGIDYSQDADVKRIVDMYLYSELPSPGTGIGVPIRFNTINDTNDWSPGFSNAWTYPSPGFFKYKSWLRPFVAWGTSTYADDPEGYGQRYAWLWAKAYRNADGSIHYNPLADWRDALWINDAAVTPYINTPTLPPAPWPKERYFRGRELIVARTDSWNQPNASAAYFSFVSGNHNYQNEHDQGDSGSFTFFSLDEDWAIDPGYGGDNLYDHNSVGIDGTGFQASGVYGDPYAYPPFGGSTHFGDVALNDGASAATVDLAGAWSMTATPYVQRDVRYGAMVNGSEQPYVVVADEIKRDNSTHSYEWCLHTGLSNTVSITGTKATVTGARTGAKLDVYSLGPESSSITSGSINDGNLGSHLRLVDTASSTTQARFLHLLLPTPSGQTAPTVTRTVVTNGIQALVDWPDGTADTILWRTGGTTITSQNGLTSDGKLTILRTSGGGVTGLTLQAGRSVTYNATTLVSASDGAQPFSLSAFGSTASVSAVDTATIRFGLPFITTVALEDGGVMIPSYNDGSTVYINGGQPLSNLRRNGGRLYDVNFNDSYIHDLFRFNLSHIPAEQFGVVNGALEIKAGPYEWPSFSRRDSTPWRRSNLFPQLIPQVQFGDADYSFRYRFNGSLGNDAKFRVYLRTTDISPADWQVNQNYVRLEFNAIQSGVVKNQVTVGQRVNGAWVGVDDNDTLTATLSPAAATLNDSNWHTVAVRLLGDAVRLTVDGNVVINGTLPTAIPTAPAAGYLQWRVTGTAPVLLDDVLVTSIDQTAPLAPTGGNLIVHLDGTGSATVTNGQGTSTDVQTLTLYESGNPIDPTTDPTTLTPVATTPDMTSLTFSGANRTAYHALGVTDTTGNHSLLLPLTADTLAPAAVGDLHIQ